MILENLFIFIFGPIFLCSIWFKKIRPAGWTALFFGFTGTVSGLLATSFSRLSFWGTVSIPILELSMFAGLPLTLAMPVIWSHRKVLVKKILPLSIILNMILIILAAFFWYRNATAVTRVELNMDDMMFFGPKKEFNSDEIKRISQTLPAIAEYLDGRNFYIRNIQENSDDTTTVFVGWFESFSSPTYTYEIDGKGMANSSGRDIFYLPTEFVFDEEMNLEKANMASPMK